MNEADRAAWSDFWGQQRRGGDGGGCLPQGWGVIDKAQQRVWHEVARKLARNARVLDLATGDARVLRWLRMKRTDLKLVGVDAAPDLPPPPQGCKVKAGITMENLPFGNEVFDLVTSQFGFEYGDMARSTTEIARVLKADGEAVLMVHRTDGPILQHNLRRQQALRWALEEQDIVGVARQASASNAAGQLLANRLGIIAAEGARQFGPQSPAWELPEAMRRSVLLALRHDPASLLATIAMLEERARNEMARITSLQRACAAADAREVMLTTTEAAGLAAQTITPVFTDDRHAFANLIVLKRS